VIRELRKGDAGRIAELHTQSFDSAWGVSDMETHIARDICLGVGDEMLDGFIIVRAADDQAEILTIAIAPEKRGTGLALALLQNSETMLTARGAGLLFLEVAEDNRAAIALYKKAGFEPIGKRPAYYRRINGRVGALTFRKTLDAGEPTG